MVSSFHVLFQSDKDVLQPVLSGAAGGSNIDLLLFGALAETGGSVIVNLHLAVELVLDMLMLPKPATMLCVVDPTRSPCVVIFRLEFASGIGSQLVVSLRLLSLQFVPASSIDPELQPLVLVPPLSNLKCPFIVLS